MSLPDARPGSDCFRCAGRESNFLTVRAAVLLSVVLSLGISAQAQTAGSASAITWSGLGGKPNSDGNWNDAANWDPAQVPGVGDTAIVPDVTSDAGKATPNTRTITVGNPISVDKITTPSGSGGNTSLVQVDSQFTVGQWAMPHDGAIHLGIAEGATFTLGSDLPNTKPLSRLPVLRGSGAFVKIGTDTVEVPAFGGPTDAWTGTIDIQKGTLHQSNATFLGKTSMLTVQSGAMVSIGDNDSVEPLGRGLTLNGTGIDGAGALECSSKRSMLSSASLDLPTDSSINISNAAGVLTLGGTVSGPGALTKIGPGKLVLVTASLGGVQITAGTLQIGGKLTSDIHIAAGATLMASEAQVIGKVTVDEGGNWIKTVVGFWSGVTHSNNDGNWHEEANWSCMASPPEATLIPVNGQGNSGNNTRTITVAADHPISVTKINTPSGSGPYTNLVQVDSQFTVGQWTMPYDGAVHLGIAEGATFTLGSDLPNTKPLSRLPVLRGSGAFVKIGTDTVEVPAFGGPTDAWTGTIDIQKGTLHQSNATFLGKTSMLTVQSGAMVSIGDNDSVEPLGRGLTLNGTGIDGAGALECSSKRSMLSSASLDLPTDSSINISNAAGVLTLGGTVSGPGALTKIGPGKLVLVTASLGGVQITEGTLQIDGKLTSDIHIAAGATLMAAEVQVIGKVTVDEGGIWDKSPPAPRVGPAGDPNDDGK